MIKKFYGGAKRFHLCGNFGTASYLRYKESPEFKLEAEN